jgi:hypothetical protein
MAPAAVSSASLCVSITPIVSRQRLGKHVPATRKNCWRRHFPCGPCRIKGKLSISSSQNFLFQICCLVVMKHSSVQNVASSRSIHKTHNKLGFSCLSDECCGGNSVSSDRKWDTARIGICLTVPCLPLVCGDSEMPDSADCFLTGWNAASRNRAVLSVMIPLPGAVVLMYRVLILRLLISCPWRTVFSLPHLGRPEALHSLMPSAYQGSI